MVDDNRRLRLVNRPWPSKTHRCLSKVRYFLSSLLMYWPLRKKLLSREILVDKNGLTDLVLCA
jgi:hypothetical protein